MGKKFLFYGVLSLLLITTTDLVYGQTGGDRDVIQFSGMVVAEDSMTVIPGVHIYVPKGGRGAVSNQNGFFSMATLAGDSVVISSVGFKRQTFTIPVDVEESFTKIFYLEIDTTFLDNVDIMPFPTEEEFKAAVLALDLPDPSEEIGEKLNGAYIAYLARNTGMDAAMASRYWLDYQNRAQFNSYGPAYNPFLNPFNWARFVDDIKKGRYKKSEYDD